MRRPRSPTPGTKPGAGRPGLVGSADGSWFKMIISDPHLRATANTAPLHRAAGWFVLANGISEVTQDDNVDVLSDISYAATNARFEYRATRF